MSLSKCFKTLFCFSYILLFIADISVIGLTSYIIHNLEQYKAFLPTIILGPLAVIIVLNIIQFPGLWKGICGILQENKTLIFIFCTSIILNSIFDIFIGLWAMKVRDEVIQDIDDIMEKSFINYTKYHYKKEEWNILQMQLKCCGNKGPMSFSNVGVDYVPVHCCNSTTTTTMCEGGGFYKNGCSNELNIFALQQLYYFILVVFLFVVIQILSIAVFCHLNAVLSKQIETTSTPLPEPEHKPLRKKSSLYK